MTMSSHRHNGLLYLALDDRLILILRKAFVSGQQWLHCAKSSLLSKVVQATWSPNEPYNFHLCSVTSPTTPPEMDLFACLDDALFAQDPTMSFMSHSEEKPSSLSSTPSQSDIPLDEDRSNSGFISGLCVIS